MGIMYQIKIFDGNTQSTAEDANKWLKENPKVVVKTASIQELHDNYLYGDNSMCNQWYSLLLVCEVPNEN